ncbi:MAG: hypothetical protein MUC51_15620 [Anaerolineae bacterium]|jgi:hypothetical protein|nr:hypothetical protein [Anaerolineae bacterium]
MSKSFATVDEYLTHERRAVRRWETIFNLLWLALAVLLALTLTACDGEVQGYPGRGAMGEAVCPAGQHVDAYGTHGVAVCVK